jgi:hypothetical protein
MDWVVQIGGFTLRMRASLDPQKMILPELYASFCFESLAAGEDMTVAVHRDRYLLPRNVRPAFVAQRPGAAQPGWQRFELQDRIVVDMAQSRSERFSRRWLVLARDHSAADLYVDLLVGDGESIPFPLEFPLDKVLWIDVLPHRAAVMIHGCAVDVGGEGLVFFGPQEAGKSTLARLWQASPEATVLSDECVVLRFHEGRPYVYGTPWAGGAQVAANRRVPVRAMFYIRHGPANEAGRKGGAETLRDLTVESFLPYYDRSAMERCLDLLARTSQSVPVYDLAFVPSREVLDFVQRVAR